MSVLGSFAGRLDRGVLGCGFEGGIESLSAKCYRL